VPLIHSLLVFGLAVRQLPYLRATLSHGRNNLFVRNGVMKCGARATNDTGPTCRRRFEAWCPFKSRVALNVDATIGSVAENVCSTTRCILTTGGVCEMKCFTTQEVSRARAPGSQYVRAEVVGEKSLDPTPRPSPRRASVRCQRSGGRVPSPGSAARRSELKRRSPRLAARRPPRKAQPAATGRQLESLNATESVASSPS
jgi:hypothetical protein